VRTQGRTQAKLRKILAAAGFDVDFFIVAEGWWRSARAADCYRWEAWCHNHKQPKLRIYLGSYDTMTDCARYGISAEEDGILSYYIGVKLPARQKPVDTPPQI
jgi:hypothetical protein